MSLSGVLGEFSVDEVLNLVCAGRKTGSVLVEASDGRVGKVYVDSGLVVGASVFGENDAAEAVFALLQLDGGSFRFSPGDAPDEMRTPDDVAKVLEAAHELDDEWKAIEQAIQSPRARLSLTAELDRDVTITPPEWGVVSSLCAGATAADLSGRMGVSLLAVGRILKPLVERGLVVVGEVVDDVLTDGGVSSVESLALALDAVSSAASVTPAPPVEPVAAEMAWAAKDEAWRDSAWKRATKEEPVKAMVSEKVISAMGARASAAVLAPAQDVDLRDGGPAGILGAVGNQATPHDIEMRNSLLRELGALGASSSRRVPLLEAARVAVEQAATAETLANPPAPVVEPPRTTRRRWR